MKTDIQSSSDGAAKVIIESAEALSLRNLGWRIAFDELGVKDDPGNVGLLTKEDKDYYQKLETTDPERYNLAFQGYIDILNDY